MAYIRKARSGRGHRIEIEKLGVRESRTFDRKIEALKWAEEREAEIIAQIKKLEIHTLAEALQEFSRVESPKRRGCRWEQIRLLRFEKKDLAHLAGKPLGHIVPADLAAWRDKRLQEVSRGSVRREMALLRAVFESARREWGWMRTNPLADVKRPPTPPSRVAKWTPDQVTAVVRALGYTEGQVPTTKQHRVALAFLFALETAMRLGEILKLTWDRVNIKGRYVSLEPMSVKVKGRERLQEATKNGDAREVPLSRKAMEILMLLPVYEGRTCFDLEARVTDALFRAAKERAKVTGVTFHDTRRTACTRLARKLPVLDLAQMIGHRDLKTLQVYYRTTATELASMLD